MTLPYNPIAWYWVVGATTDTVFSSASMSYVPVTDPDYLAFRASGMAFSWCDRAESLAEVMLSQALPRLGQVGVQVSSTATPALDGTYAIDEAAQSAIVALATGIASGKPLPGGGTTFNYRDMGGTRHAFTGANFLAFAAAIEDYIYLLEEAIISRVSGDAATLPSASLVIA